MASAMHHTMQTCSNLVAMTQSQILDEDKVDPFPARTTIELEEMLDACRRTKEVLSRESLIYSPDADFSKYSDTELVAMNAFVRENSRMLSIILAGGSQHFWNGQGATAAQELKNMYPFIDEKVKDFLLIDKIMETLEIKTKFKDSKRLSQHRSNNLSGHPDLLAFTAIDANRAPTSQESLKRLATVCEQFAEQCRSIAQVRILKMEDRQRKMATYEKLLSEIESILPALRQHVLKIGLSKTQLQAKDDKRLQDVDPKVNFNFECQTQRLTSLFTYKAVEGAHRGVEDCRERVMQEILFRRAKVGRRLQREEEMEAERARQQADQMKSSIPGSSTNAGQYANLVEEAGLKRSGSKEKSAQPARDSPTGRGPSSQQSLPSSPGSTQIKEKKSASPDDKASSKKEKARQSSRSPSPKSPKSKAKAAAKSKINTGLRPSEAKDESPRKSPKAEAPKAKPKAKT